MLSCPPADGKDGKKAPGSDETGRPHDPLDLLSQSRNPAAVMPEAGVPCGAHCIALNREVQKGCHLFFMSQLVGKARAPGMGGKGLLSEKQTRLFPLPAHSQPNLPTPTSPLVQTRAARSKKKT